MSPAREQIAATMGRVKALTPELVPFLRELQAEGLITGGSNVSYCGPHRPDSPGSLHLGQIVIESAATLKQRMGIDGKPGR